MKSHNVIKHISREEWQEQNHMESIERLGAEYNKALAQSKEAHKLYDFRGHAHYFTMLSKTTTTSRSTGSYQTFVIWK